MSNFMVRMETEYNELDQRINKLGVFINGPFFLTLPAEDQSLLYQQHNHMVAYHKVLFQRMLRAKSVQ